MLGYYAHSHGYGHSTYADSLSKVLDEQLTIFTDSDYNFSNARQVITMPDEDLDGSELTAYNCEKPVFLHHNPLGLKKITVRNTLFLNSVLELELQLVLIDVSVEMAALCRVSSIPYAYRRMPGDRSDLPHLEAYKCAVFLFAFYPEELESSETPGWIVEKTIYAGFIKYTEDSHSLPLKNTAAKTSDIINVLIYRGKGGSLLNAGIVEQLSKALPQAQIHLIGGEPLELIDNDKIIDHGWVNNPVQFIQDAQLVLSSCGSTSIAQLIALERTFIAMPEERPYDEQKQLCAQLHKLNIAVPLKKDNINSTIQEYLNLKPQFTDAIAPVSIEPFAHKILHYATQLEQHYIKTQ